jgi:hypothetical protein
MEIITILKKLYSIVKGFCKMILKVLKGYKNPTVQHIQRDNGVHTCRYPQRVRKQTVFYGDPVKF